ncbi:AAA family ATPase [Candidatus Magnetomoraceae bacterium gMMP-15]
MRYFNTSGPCNPKEHYTVMRENLILKGRELVEKGRYFTIFAPRQAGKTTFFQLLMHELKEEYTPIWISFEYLKNVSNTLFYEDVADQLFIELSKFDIKLENSIKNNLDFKKLFHQIQDEKVKPVILFIDEFEGIPDSVLGELMHTFRNMYHRKKDHALHSLALVGVSTISELVVSSASPFNIVEELKIPYFTFDEVNNLIYQHINETGHIFEENVIRAIYENTKGQPGLVCGLCLHLVDDSDFSTPVRMKDFYKTLKYFLIEKIDKNISNIIQKAREKKPFMIRLLFTERPIPYTIDDPDISWLYANGVIDNANGYVDIPVPLYSKRLINAFRPLINGEIDHYFSVHEKLTDYATADGLNIRAILQKYQRYVRRRGFKTFDTEHLKEAAWHYSLDGFVNFIIECLGGQTFIEVPSGRGRTDILILYKDQKYIIETKIFINNIYFENGKLQLAEYLESEGLKDGYYIVFSNKHTEKDKLEFDETVNEKQIYTCIIRTNFDMPSKKKARKRRKSKKK